MSTRRYVANDGLTSTEVVTYSSRSTRIRTLSPALQSIDDYERFWQSHAPPAKARVPHHSLPWFARKILQEVAEVRRAVERRNTDAAVYWALRVGDLHGFARARLPLGELARLGVKRREQWRQAGRRSGQQRRTKRDAIKQLAETLRQTHPYDRQRRSTRWLADRIGKELKLSPSTVRAALRASNLT